MACSTKLGVFIRSLSTTQSMSQMIKPPVQVFGLEGRYAAALYSAATKMKQIESAEKELVQIQDALKKNANLKQVITSPIINKKLMATTLKDASVQMALSPATTNLLVLLAEHGRLPKLEGVINAFRTIMAAHRGEVVCEVVTAKPLDAGQRKQLEDALKKFVKAKETIQLTARVDSSIIGGMVVSIGDKYVDMSIATKVKKYTDLITAAA